MTEKRYVEELWAYDDIMVKDNETGEELWNNMIYERMNKQNERIKELEIENENQNNILEDFMVMLNRLQANPNNEVLQSMTKDMLRMMGKDIMGDVE